MPVRTTRALPGRCPTPTPTGDAPLEQLLAPLVGDVNPLNVGAALPASNTMDALSAARGAGVGPPPLARGRRRGIAHVRGNVKGEASPPPYPFPCPRRHK
ncbi:unnamed protein product [Prorocentrum cordatum]|uniref:Uncharacterized protein n=1 Tax=Prorocentrum cordatum TaxID=2364126 RepID=A0ABN9YBV4_9DINO|nr:unnamed protein product [Polarella glacialis]